MKLKDVQVGGRYTCKVSGRLVTVRVRELKEVYAFNAWRTQIVAVNESTGREIRIRSPQRLRAVAGPG